MTKWKIIICKTCGFKYQSHPNVLDEKKLNGNCIKCRYEKENKEKRCKNE